jgi:predicted Zn-dependent protease
MEKRPTCLLTVGVLSVILSVLTPTPATAADFDLLSVMKQELDRSLTNLANAEEAPLYYLQYSVTDLHEYTLSVTDGGLNAPESSNRRFLDVDLRVGSIQLDNTHEIRSGNWRDNYSPTRLVDFPLEPDADAVRAALWNETEYQYRKAHERLTKVEANRQVKVEEEDLSNDFSPGEAHNYSEPPRQTQIDEDHWSGVLSRVGDYLAEHDFVQRSSATISATDRNSYMVNSEGSALQHGNTYLRLMLNVSGMADDGMDLRRSEYWSATDPANFPDEATIMENAERLVAELDALRSAPVVEPYIGPAILMNRASGVFFHEIFGHRIEGHRQKSESEGQTFTKKVGELILPDFISVYDDPTMAEFEDTELRGYYKFDDEGVPAERVTVVENGILRNFLMSRSPIEGFPRSNAHGRREHGNDVVARQGNLIIESEKIVSYDELRRMLIEECERQGKPYGLIFDDISGGFTMTGRGGPQAFKVLPLYVTRVYADGRPDEVVRGVDIVGTPLTSFSKIVMAADDADVFNGTCGAESGWCPVSAVSPSLLVSEIEVEKRRKGQDKPPILPPPSIGGDR